MLAVITVRMSRRVDPISRRSTTPAANSASGRAVARSAKSDATNLSKGPDQSKGGHRRPSKGLQATQNRHQGSMARMTRAHVLKRDRGRDRLRSAFSMRASPGGFTTVPSSVCLLAGITRPQVVGVALPTPSTRVNKLKCQNVQFPRRRSARAPRQAGIGRLPNPPLKQGEGEPAAGPGPIRERCDCTFLREKLFAKRGRGAARPLVT